jgi:exonuclease SbcD
MRILHTADWHLGDRLGRIDRTDDLRRGVERIAGYCTSEKVDVLLMAGDLFSELAGPDGLREAVRHLQTVFEGFLRDGGSILALTGNHDKETFCQTLRHAMSLAAPLSDVPGAVLSPGRLYLAVEPSLVRLPDRATGGTVQFMLMPYPTPARYLTDAVVQRYQGLDEKNRHLVTAYTRKMSELQGHDAFDWGLPTVLGAHITVKGSEMPTLFRLSEEEDVLFSDEAVPVGFAYVALGHIHRPQAINGHSHVRYCGSLDRLDLGESRDDKGIVITDIGPEGRRDEPYTLPLEATPVYRVEIRSPADELPTLAEKYPDHERAVVRIECTWKAGTDNREEVLRELDRLFPRWYDRNMVEVSALDGTLVIGEPTKPHSFQDTVRDYLAQELANHDDALRDAVLARAEGLMDALMKEVQA